MMKFGVVKTFCLCVVCNRESVFLFRATVLRRRVFFFVADKSTRLVALVVFVLVVVGVFMSSCL